VRSGCDGKKYGACPLAQRVFMVLMMKASHTNNVRFIVATVPSGRPPDEFKRHGLRNLPAIIFRGEALDTVEEIVDFIDTTFPEDNLDNMAETATLDTAETATLDFFSKFCFFIKAVSRDGSSLHLSLAKLDSFLKVLGTPFLGGNTVSHLDCEVLPKLHHLRVAASVLKGFSIPNSFSGIWRYLHSGYNNPIFVKSCPPDQEILLYWADRPDTPSITLDDHYSLTRETPRFSFDVPALATPVEIN